MKPELENLKEYTSKLSLTSEEKLNMFNNLRTYSNANPVRSKYTMLFRNSFTYASMFALLIGTSATSLAAEGALPGDILYPVKTEVNEAVVKSLSFSPSAKAKVAVNLMDKRMNELTEMIVTEVDSPEKIDTIVAMLEEHKEDLQDFTDQIEQTNPEEVQEATEIYVALETVLDTHIDILEEIAEDEETQLAIADVADVVVTNTASETPTQEEPVDNTVVLTMMAAPAPETPVEPVMMAAKLQSTSTDDMATTSIIADSVITGEEDAVFEITNFSTRIDPLIESAKSKASVESESTSTKIRNEVRKRIIDTVEQDLKIDIEEGTTIEIETIIK